VADRPVASPCADIAAVVVTYGSRLRFLEPTLEGLASQAPVGRIVVVDNGAVPAVGQWLGRRGASDPRVRVVSHADNLGSAGGFRAGLAAASAGGQRFVWLLDDDTRPEPGAADALLAAWPALADGPQPELTALLSQRWDAERYRRESAWNVNAAFGIDLLDVVGRRLGIRGVGAQGSDAPLTVRMAPWSGLFFARTLLDRIGLPDDRFVSYEEDHEFTLRIGARGGRIIVVPASRLTTLETSWLDSARGQFVSARLKPHPAGSTGPDLADVDRVYYGARNRVYLETRHLVTHRLRYLLNLGAFVVRVAVSGLGPGARRKTRWFLAGIADGWRGRLGRRRPRPQENPPSSFSR
jgi:hypothetical protein